MPSDDVTRHSGAGRFLRVRQRTMTWWERGLARGTVSLADLFVGHRPPADARGLALSDLTSRVVTPGFPAMAGLVPSRARTMVNA